MIVSVYFFFFHKLSPNDPVTKVKLELIEKSYGNQINRICEERGLPSDYFKALIMLETSGNIPAGKRYEKHVYQKLRDLQTGSSNRFEDLASSDLRGLNKKDLKWLATSVGPFQIMGYKSIKMNCAVKDFHNKNAIETGIKWIDKEYGWMLKQERYKDAFHYHNTGQLHPKNSRPLTYSPNYVKNGLSYMNYYDN